MLAHRDAETVCCNETDADPAGADVAADALKSFLEAAFPGPGRHERRTSTHEGDHPRRWTWPPARAPHGDLPRTILPIDREPMILDICVDRPRVSQRQGDLIVTEFVAERVEDALPALRAGSATTTPTSTEPLW